MMAGPRFGSGESTLWIVLLSVIMCWIERGSSFNVDTVNFIRHRGDTGSMFGFSVAEHKEFGKSWVLVGAPEAQTRQSGVDRGGAVYRCETTRDDVCEQIEFDKTGNNNNSDGRQIDKKSYQWFGATVRSSGENGVVLACAPRYVWFSTSTAYRRDPVGTCFVAKNQFQDFSEFSPCRTRNWGYHRQGSCQAGLGADVSKDGQRLYVGAPGSWYWQGQIYDISSSFKMPTVSPDYSKTNELNLIAYESGNKDGRNKSGTLSNKNNQQNGGGQLYAQNPHKIPEIWATSEGSPQDDDSYLGYSVTSGDFDGRGTGGVAVGMPRGANLLGKVVLYTANLTNLQNITGHQLGSYFAYSVAAVDVDGDSLDDLIIGAPLYTDLSNNEGKYETGRVYIYINEPRYDQEGYYVRFSRFTFRDGTNSKARFGHSVAALGDINKDGYGDFAVGAPYDGEAGRGAVYVFHGMRKGVRENPSQIIKGEELSVPVSTFGFAISGGLDMDGNQYPDMIVGAYESDTTIFFRSRPVVKVVESRVTFDSRNKQISLEDKPCTLRDYTKVSCTSMEACLRYSGPEVSDYLDFDIGIALDSKKTKSQRMYFVDDEGKYIKNDTIRLSKGQLNCKTYKVYIKPNIRDKLTPLEAELRYNVITRNQAGSGRRYTRSLEPALDTTDQNIRKDSISIQKNCGPDNICIPDLRLTTKKSVSKYLLGSGEKFALDVMVENRGEDAFEAMYNLEVPAGMNFVNIERLDSDRSIPVQCSAPSAFTNNTLRCDIGNPLPKGKLVNFKVLLQPFHQEGMKPSYAFVSTVNSTNPEEEFTSTDNLQRFTVPIWVETDLVLSGSSHPSEVHYNSSHYEGNITHESEIGPQIVHIYSIRNKGPANILEAQAIFLWPSYTLAGDHLLYLLEQPETSGNIKCEYVENVNEEHIELDRKRKSYLESGQVAYAAQRVGQESGSSSKKTFGRKGKGKMTEEERRRMELEGFRKPGDADFDGSEDAHRQRIHLQASSDRRFNGSTQRVSSGSGGRIQVTDGSRAQGTWGRQGSSGGSYEESYYSQSQGGSSSGTHRWREEGGAMQGRRIGGGGYRGESENGRHEEYYIDRGNRDWNDDSDWGTPDTDAMRRAYGGNEFRTVALDLNSNIPVINIGESEAGRSEIHRTGSRTYGGSQGHGGSYHINVAGSGSEERGSGGVFHTGGYSGQEGETRTVHVSHGGTSRTYSTTGGSSTSHGAAYDGGVRSGGAYEIHVGGREGGSYDREYEKRKQEEEISGSRTIHVAPGSSYEIHVAPKESTTSEGGSVATHTVHEGGSRTYEIHVGGAGSQQSTSEGGESGTRTQTVHVSQGGGSRTYEVHGGTTGDRRIDSEMRTHYGEDESRRKEGSEGGTRTQTVHVSQGGSTRTYEIHGGATRTHEEESRRQEAEMASGGRTHTVHVSGGRTYEVHGGSTRTHDKEAETGTGGRTHTVHVSQGGRTYEVHGGSTKTTDEDAETGTGGRTHTVHVSGGRTYEIHGGSTRTHDEEAETGTGGRTHTVHVSGGRTYEVHGGSRGSYDKESERRQEAGVSGSTATHSVHVTEEGSTKTYEFDGGSRDSYDEEARRTEGAGAGSTTHTVHSSQGGRTYDVRGGSRGSYDEEARRQDIGRGGSTTHTVHVSQGGRTYEVHGGSRDSEEEERRRQESSRTHTVHHMIHGGRTYDEDRGGDARISETEREEGVTRTQTVHVTHGGSYGHTDTYDSEYERRRQEMEAAARGRSESTTPVSQGGSSRTYVTQGGSTEHRATYDQEYERRRLEAEAAERARAGGSSAGTRHHSTQYSYHMNTTVGSDGRRPGNGSGYFSWDTGSTGYDRSREHDRRVQEDMEKRVREKAERELEESLRRAGGRIVDGGATRWVVFDNGTIVTVGAVQDADYEKRIREELRRRLRDQLEREREEKIRQGESSFEQEYERRKMQLEAATVSDSGRNYGSGSSHHYSTHYSYYNTTSGSGDSNGGYSWDPYDPRNRRIEEDLKRRWKGKGLHELEDLLRNTGGRVVEGGSSRWVVFDNGTIVSVGATDNPEYENRLREEFSKRLRQQWGRDQRFRNSGSGGSVGRTTHWYSYSNESTEYGHDPDYQRRLQEEWDRRYREGSHSSQDHYYNRTYRSESKHTVEEGGAYDPDLGYVRRDDGDKSGVRYFRTRHRISSNGLEDETSEKDVKKGERSKREHVIPRFKRLVEDGVDLKSSLKCGPIDCTKIMCTVGPLSRGQEAWVAFRGRLWAQTLKKIGHDRVIRLSSLQASQLTKLPHIGEPESAKVETHEVFTEIMPQDAPLKPEVAPLWIWVLSACAGTLILLLLIFLLWKLGFFKRNRPSTAPEKQPLNRNGYQAGDEAL